MKKPMDNLTLSAEDGEALIARVHLSNLPRADAETVEWVIRMYFHMAFALQEANISTKRLRSLLFGKNPAPSPLSEASLAASQADGDEASVCAVLDADAEPEATANQAAWRIAEAGGGQGQGRTPPGNGSPGCRGLCRSDAHRVPPRGAFGRSALPGVRSG